MPSGVKKRNRQLKCPCGENILNGVYCYDCREERLKSVRNKRNKRKAKST